MAFPATPLDVVYEIYVNGDWIEVTTDVYDLAPVTLTRGRRDETSRPEPANLAFTFDNDSGDYSPPNPVGAYYGSFGENTPLRTAIRRSIDTFTRTVSNGWGSTDSGHAWTTVKGAGGTVQASDYGVGSGVGTMSVPVANGYRFATLAGIPVKEIDVRAQVTVPFTDVTGAAIYPISVLLRGVSDTDWVWAWVEISTAEAVRVGISHFDGTVIASGVTVAGLTHASSQALVIRAQAEGHTYRAKVWALGSPEPSAWQVSGHSTRNAAPGFVGLMNLVASGNTNTKPIIASYDNVTVRHPRFAGELSDLKVRWNPPGTYVYTDVVAQGIRRRLGQGASPLLGAARRRINHILTTPVGQPFIRVWFPLEDDSGTVIDQNTGFSAAEVLVGSGVVRVFGFGGSGNASFGGDTGAPGAPRAVTLSSSGTSGGDVILRSLPTDLSATSWGVMWALKCEANKRSLTWVRCAKVSGIISTGDISLKVVAETNGVVSAYLTEVGTSSQVLIMDTTVRSGGWADNDWHHYIATARQNGTSIDFTLWVDGAQVDSHTETTATLLRITDVQHSSIDGSDAYGPFSASHTVILDGYPGSWHADTIDAISDASLGHRGERALTRIQRVLVEENIPLDYIGEPADTPAMGPQPSATLLDILDQCADADLGVLAEPRGEIGFLYRTRASHYTQDAVLDLNYADQEVVPPFEPSNDDALTRNDIRVGRIGGASPARAVLLTGRKSVLAPKDGGVGRYDDSRTLSLNADDQTVGIAYWLLAQGTVDEPRWPRISADMSVLVDAGKDIDAADVNLGDRLTVSEPFARYSPSQISQLALGYTETVRNFTHRVDFNTAPESPYRVGTANATGHRADAANSVLSGGPYSSSATSLTVTSAAPGGPWITGAVSIDLAIAGEAVRVTNITSATSPQTFTVTRSINGVVKGQVNGARVRLAQPVRVGLGS